MSKLYNMESGELNDKKIVKLLEGLPEMYKNGELVEVQTICQEIANAIIDFSQF